MISNTDKLLTLEELASNFDVSIRTVRRLIASGVIPYYRFSRKMLRFSPDEIAQALDRLRIPARSELRKKQTSPSQQSIGSACHQMSPK